MPENQKSRRLTAIVAADMVGYSGMMESDEASTFESLKLCREELIDPLINKYEGRVFKTTGDGFLAEFPSVVQAVNFAVEFKEALAQAMESDRFSIPVIFRCGINLGDVIIDRNDLFGEGVNVAARLEQMAKPGTILVSQQIYAAIGNKLDITFKDLGERTLKNIKRLVRVYEIVDHNVLKAGVSAIQVVQTAENKSYSQPRSKFLMVALAAVIVIAIATGWLWLSNRASVSPDVDVADQKVISQGTALSDKPSLMVLPFDNLSGDPEQKYFSDGLTEDITTDISRISGLLVLARNTAFAYAGKPVDIRQIGRDLGVRYILEGSVRRAGDRVRVNAQLIDATTGNHLWADRFDQELKDVFKLQDEITKKIVSALTIRLTSSEDLQLRQSKQVNPLAYDNFLKGLERFQRFTPDNNKEAREFFKEAARLDPTFARAIADIGLSHSIELLFNWTDDPQASIAAARVNIGKAIELDATIREVQFASSAIHLSEKQLDAAIEAARQALLIDPSYADAYAQMAQSMAYNGNPEESLAAMEKAKKLNPLYPFFYTWIESLAHFVASNYKDAIRLSQDVATRNPEFTGARLILAASYSLTGENDDAEWEIEELLTNVPHFTLAAAHERALFSVRTDMERYMKGLRQAGLK